MPCDAIAVAGGQIPLDLVQELESLGAEVLSQALLALLRRQFAHLGEPELTRLYGAHTGIPAEGIGVRIGDYLILVKPNGRVVANAREPWLGDQETVNRLRDAVTNLLTGLAGLAVQKRVAQAIRQAGYRVLQEQRAPNGALVLQVEL